MAGIKRLQHLFGVDLEELSDLLERRSASGTRGHLALGLFNLERQLLDAARYMHDPAAIAEVALQLAEDRRNREGLEGDAPSRVEAVDRLHQPEAGDLLEVLDRLMRAAVAVRELVGQRQEAPNQRLSSVGITVLLPGDEQMVDWFTRRRSSAASYNSSTGHKRQLPPNRRFKLNNCTVRLEMEGIGNRSVHEPPASRCGDRPEHGHSR